MISIVINRYGLYIVKCVIKTKVQSWGVEIT